MNVITNLFIVQTLNSNAGPDAFKEDFAVVSLQGNAKLVSNELTRGAERDLEPNPPNLAPQVPVEVRFKNLEIT